MAVSISEIDIGMRTLKQVVKVSHSEQVHFLVVYRLYPPCPSLSSVRMWKPNVLPADSCKLSSMSKQVRCFQNMQKRKCEITPIADIDSNLKRPRNAKSSLMGVSSPQAEDIATLPKSHMNPTRKSVPFYDIRHLLRDQMISFQGIHLRNVQDSHGFWWPGVNSDLEALSCVTGQVGMSFIPLAPTPGPPQWTKVLLRYQILYIFLLKVAVITQLQVYLQKKRCQRISDENDKVMLSAKRMAMPEWFLTLRFSLKHWKWKSELVAQLHNISLVRHFLVLSPQVKTYLCVVLKWWSVLMKSLTIKWGRECKSPFTIWLILWHLGT